MKKIIPLSVPNIIGNEPKYVQECLTSGWIYLQELMLINLKNQLRIMLSYHAVATVNGTSALYISLLLWCKKEIML